MANDRLKKWFGFPLISLVFHLGVGGLVFFLAEPPTKIKQPKVVKMTIKRVEKPKPKVVEPPKVEKPKPKPKPKPKTKKKKPKPKKKKKVIKKKPKVERKPKKQPVKEAPPVQGLSPDALTKGATGISAPVGNTLMREDEGKRLKPEEIQPLEQNLSAEASLIRDTLETPEYTEDAIYAGLEGTFTIEVFVDKFGNVGEVDISPPIGYGMDERIVASVEAAKFRPRKNKEGKSLSGWTELQFKLELP